MVKEASVDLLVSSVLIDEVKVDHDYNHCQMLGHHNKPLLFLFCEAPQYAQ
jgi:hypothetical protein